MWITWKDKSEALSWPLTFEQKVDLFYEQTLGWQLHIADLVANGGTAFGEDGNRKGATVSSIRHSGFAVLQICLSYFETIGRYMFADVGSKNAFVVGVFAVFPELGKAGPETVKGFIDELYKGARCGLYHNVRTATVLLGWSPGDAAIVYDQSSNRVVVSPERLPRRLKEHLDSYRAALLNEANQDMRDRFSQRFDDDSGAA